MNRTCKTCTYEPKWRALAGSFMMIGECKNELMPGDIVKYPDGEFTVCTPHDESMITDCSHWESDIKNPELMEEG